MKHDRVDDELSLEELDCVAGGGGIGWIWDVIRRMFDRDPDRFPSELL